MFLPRTDLALEAAALTSRKDNEVLEGVETEEYSKDGVKVTCVKVINTEGERIIGKARGSYITIECESLRDATDVYDKNAKEIFTEELKKVIGPHNPKSIFVLGLGNRYVTPDSLGPRVTENINVQSQNPALCCVSPGVLGITGIESVDIAEGITERIKPDVVIAIDALASRSMHRICTTIQIADTGITPGAGVGNRQKALSKETLGIPVIAIGVPTVVDASTVANDSAQHILKAMGEDTENPLFDENKRYAIIKKILNPYFGELIVTPSQIDCVITKVSNLISDGINDLENNL